MSYKRIAVALITGAILGVFCIVGAQGRTEEVLSNSYLFGFWFNRFLMGFVIGLLPDTDIVKRLVRGLLVGLFVSFAFYSATNYFDLLGFLVGGVYGMIIEGVLHQFGRRTV